MFAASFMLRSSGSEISPNACAEGETCIQFYFCLTLLGLLIFNKGHQANLKMSFTENSYQRI